MSTPQRSTVYCLISALLAASLLIGPVSVWRVIDNVVACLSRLKKEDRGRTYDEISRRNSRCLVGRSVFDKAESVAIIHGDSQAEGGTATSTTPPLRESDFVLEEYKTVAAEIRERMSHENILFALKFTLVGAIIWLLFSVFGRREHDFERFAHDRRAAVFFMAALLSNAVVDSRLRFNARIVESLGDWVWCLEGSLVGKTARVAAMWEHFLHLQLDAGSFPIMRHFCHSLTPILFAVALYLFVVVARSIHRSTMAMIVRGGFVYFALLGIIAYSHDHIIAGSSWTTWVFVRAVPITLAFAGWWCLRKAYRLRFDQGNVFRRAQEFVLQHGKERPELLEDWVTFGAVHRVRDLVEVVESNPVGEVYGSVRDILARTFPTSIQHNEKDGYLDIRTSDTPYGKYRCNRQESLVRTISASIDDRLRNSADISEDRLWKVILPPGDDAVAGGRRWGDRTAGQPPQVR